MKDNIQVELQEFEGGALSDCCMNGDWLQEEGAKITGQVTI